MKSQNKEKEKENIIHAEIQRKKVESALLAVSDPSWQSYRSEALFTERVLSLAFLNSVYKSSMNSLSLISGDQSIPPDTVILWDSLLAHEVVHNET